MRPVANPRRGAGPARAPVSVCSLADIPKKRRFFCSTIFLFFRLLRGIVLITENLFKQVVSERKKLGGIIHGKIPGRCQGIAGRDWRQGQHPGRVALHDAHAIRADRPQKGRREGHCGHPLGQGHLHAGRAVPGHHRQRRGQLLQGVHPVCRHRGREPRRGQERGQDQPEPGAAHHGRPGRDLCPHHPGPDLRRPCAGLPQHHRRG